MVLDGCPDDESITFYVLKKSEKENEIITDGGGDAGYFVDAWGSHIDLHIFIPCLIIPHHPWEREKADVKPFLGAPGF